MEDLFEQKLRHLSFVVCDVSFKNCLRYLEYPSSVICYTLPFCDVENISFDCLSYHLQVNPNFILNRGFCFVVVQ